MQELSFNEKGLGNLHGKNGLNQLIKFLRWSCRVINSYRSSMVSAINATSGATTEQKAAAIAAIDAVMAACAALEFFMTIYEP